jgi:hypothetical protein
MAKTVLKWEGPTLLVMLKREGPILLVMLKREGPILLVMLKREGPTLLVMHILNTYRLQSVIMLRSKLVSISGTNEEQLDEIVPKMSYSIRKNGLRYIMKYFTPMESGNFGKFR